ncbi:sensor histidine kinase [Actinoplanes sp. NPDC049681]|uniref:sensor histidine kinase n=1 Tax=Actinoplanes sp. NPDC049681 TaxID=3363905 RepID=UPI00378A1B40
MTNPPRQENPFTTYRSARHLVAGAALGALAGSLLTVMAVLWFAAVFSLFAGTTSDTTLVITYASAALVLPAAVLWLAREFAKAHRDRFRWSFGIDIPTPTLTWKSAGRYLTYHLIALVLGVPAVVLVLMPPAARRYSKADVMMARALLAPGGYERLAQRVESLSRSRADVIAATDAERRRIERDLHDGIQQRLMSLAMNLGMAREALTEPSPARDAIVAAHEEAVVTLAELRQFVRGLHPAVLDDRGLDAALSGIAARAPIPVAVSVDVQPRCAATVEAIAYFIVSEALTNVVKHASAERADVVVVRRDERLHMTVSDDGCGGAVMTPDGGLTGLARRTASVDGTMTLQSPVGGPTILSVELPCA